MPKYLLISHKFLNVPEQGHGWPAYTETIPVLNWFDTDEELLFHMKTWGKDIKDPQIFELAGKVTLETTTTLALKK